MDLALMLTLLASQAPATEPLDCDIIIRYCPIAESLGSDLPCFEFDSEADHIEIIRQYETYCKVVAPRVVLPAMAPILNFLLED